MYSVSQFFWLSLCNTRGLKTAQGLTFGYRASQCYRVSQNCAKTDIRIQGVSFLCDFVYMGCQNEFNDLRRKVCSSRWSDSTPEFRPPFCSLGLKTPEKGDETKQKVFLLLSLIINPAAEKFFFRFCSESRVDFQLRSEF